jgi:DNA (cytosine-5)-methyltransferase 1
MGGKHRANIDHRDMFPATVDVVRKLRPKSLIIENVKGLTRAAFSDYFQYIQLQLEFPELVLYADEPWFDHYQRLLLEHRSGREHGRSLTYQVTPRLVNAANFGVPQKRERVFMVGFRADLGINWAFPQQTHSFDSLLHSQWISGEYWDRHKIAKRRRPAIPDNLADRVRNLSLALPPCVLEPWQTIRDVLIDLSEPESSNGGFIDHKFQPGARRYAGHTGSPLDLPAKTLKAGDHGVPGGENMMIKDDGSVRYLTVRESARIQTFPDGFVFHGSWTETMRQLGNAVPLVLAHRVASGVAEALIAEQFASLAFKLRAKPLVAAEPAAWNEFGTGHSRAA